MGTNILCLCCLTRCVHLTDNASRTAQIATARSPIVSHVNGARGERAALRQSTPKPHDSIWKVSQVRECVRRACLTQRKSLGASCAWDRPRRAGATRRRLKPATQPRSAQNPPHLGARNRSTFGTRLHRMPLEGACLPLHSVARSAPAERKTTHCVCVSLFL
jgi:hypothetical protein